MKLYEIIAFNEFYLTSINNQKMNINAAYQINKIIQSFKSDLDFYQNELKKIFDDCVEQENGQYKMSEDQQNFLIKQDKIQEFEQRFNDLRNIEVNFDDSLKIDVSIFGDIQITPQEILNITNFLK